MFITILDFIKQKNLLSTEAYKQLVTFTESLVEKTVDIEQVFTKVKVKYDFDNLINLSLNKGDVNGKAISFNRIGFWMERYEFLMSIGIEGDMDEEFMLIINDNDVSIPYTEEISDEEREHLFRISFKIFYSWLGYIWQSKQLSACGIPMCIEVNSDTMTYYFNDFLKHYYSSFHNIYPQERIQGTVFKRNLSLEEIFISTYFFRDNINEVYLYATRANQFIKINMIKEKYLIFKGAIDSEEILIEEKKHTMIHSYKPEEDSSMRKVVQDFRAYINDNWIFDLRKSEFKL